MREILNHLTRLTESAAPTGATLFSNLEKELIRMGAPTLWEGEVSGIGRVAAEAHRLRFMAMGDVLPFLRSKELDAFVADQGWQFTRRMDTTTKNGKPALEVRMEPLTGGVEATDVPEVILHVTGKENLSSILKTGIEARRSSRPQIIDYHNRVHFVRTEEAALRIADLLDASDGVENDYVVIHVKSSGLELFVDPEWESQGLISHSSVPPERIIGFKKMFFSDDEKAA